MTARRAREAAQSEPPRAPHYRVRPDLDPDIDLAALLAHHAATLTYDKIDPPNRDAMRRLILDSLGACVAGAWEAGCVEIRDQVEEWGGATQATVIQSGVRVPVHNAVAVNSTMCRALEFDDVSESALMHISATIVPVAFAAAESSSRPISGRELITAMVAGVDIANRISLAPRLNPTGPGHRARGMSFTYQVGTMVAAALVAKIAGADGDGILNAIGMGYSNAAGNQQVLVENALATRVQQGLSASNGVVAGQLALRGVTGPRSPLEGRCGYYPTYWGNDYDRERALDHLGERLTVVDVSIKPYPCCKFVHTAVAAALQARRDPAFRLEQIDKVVLIVDNPEYFALVCEPLQAKKTPGSPIEAQFSMPYCVAVALIRGALTLRDFQQESLSDTYALALASKIECRLAVAEPRTARKLPTPGHVEVHLSGGGAISADAAYAPGHPNQPLSWDEVLHKFEDCCEFPARPLPLPQRTRLVGAVKDLENHRDVRSLFQDHLVW